MWLIIYYWAGQIVGVIFFNGAPSQDSETVLNLMFTSQPSPRWLAESKSNATMAAEVVLVRRTLAWLTGIILLIATLLGVRLYYFNEGLIFFAIAVVGLCKIDRSIRSIVRVERFIVELLGFFKQGYLVLSYLSLSFCFYASVVNICILMSFCHCLVLVACHVLCYSGILDFLSQ